MTSIIKCKTFMRIGYVRVSKEEQNEALGVGQVCQAAIFI